MTRKATQLVASKISMKLAGITILSKVNTLYSLSWLWRVFFEYHLNTKMWVFMSFEKQRMTLETLVISYFGIEHYSKYR